MLDPMGNLMHGPTFDIRIPLEGSEPYTNLQIPIGIRLPPPTDKTSGIPGMYFVLQTGMLSHVWYASHGGQRRPGEDVGGPLSPAMSDQHRR